MTVAAIPLSDPNATGTGEPTIGNLVRDATTQVSALVRAEVELARAEVIRDVKKGVAGSIFFIAALVVLFYSTFFFFFFAAEVLKIWLPAWAAYLIIFAAMVFVAVLAVLVGYLQVRRIRGPQATIESVKETASVFSREDDAPAATKAIKPADPSGW
ncbi:membrane protein [Mycobacteroides immunogenum]|nr:membrane protein [Mycobacteroides immunogenum]